jgi:anti-sigma-K factor RskA/sigma-70-like protein
MLTLPADRIQAALERLPPGSRALLELSARPELTDGQIAELLRVDPAEVARRRERAIRRLAGELGVDPDDRLGERLVEHLTGEPAQEPAAPELPPERRRRTGLAVTSVLFLGAVIGAVIALTSGGGDHVGKKKNEPTRTSRPARGPAVALTALPGAGHAAGTARLHGDRLHLRVRALPAPQGRYSVWLYNSIDSAVPIASFSRGTFSLNRKLGADPARFRFVDVSLEPNDGNPNHSGASLLRVRMDRLEAGS